MRRCWGKKAGFALAAMLVASCSSAVDAMRNVTGASKNDPGPDARNTQNLEAGSERPYPNLGTVPAPPVRALSTAEREALQKSLAADRANAKYIDEQLRAGQTAIAPRPAPRPAATPEEKAAAEAAPPPSQAAPQAAPAQPSAPPPSAAGPLPTAEPPPAAAPPTPVQAQELANEAPATPPEARGVERAESPAAAPPPASAPQPTVQPQSLANEAPSTPPEVRSVPQAETPAAAPPPPVLKGPGAPPPVAAPPPAASSTPAPRTSTPPAAVPSAPAQPPQQLATLGPGQPAAEIAFARDSAAFQGSGRSRLAEIAAAQRERGGTVRVVAEAAPAGGTSGALAAFSLALDRANAVAVALADAGVPQRSIQVETAPPGTAPGRARIYLQN
jgi:hypothetical protein